MRALLIGGAMMIGTAAQAHEVMHDGHEHAHKADCGHTALQHDGHVDYLHDGHLHAPHGDHVDEHVLMVSDANPADELLVARVDDKKHRHSAGDNAHSRVQHGDHFDHIHDGQLHHVHGDHVDNHGAVTLLKADS